MTEFRLGVDIGRVIIHGDGPDTSFIGCTDEASLATPELPGATATIRRLTELLDGRVWLVSKCGERIANRSRAWLQHHEFFQKTGIDPDHLRFCRKRPEKAGICKELGITCFIDDRLDVLEAMVGVVPHRFLFGEHSSWNAVHSAYGITAVRNWVEVEPAVYRARAAHDLKACH